MANGQKKVKSVFLKVLVYLFSIALINVLTLQIPKTYSWFSNSKIGLVNASVVNSQDIVEIRIGYDSNYDNINEYYTVIPKQQETISTIINPKEIIVTRKDKTSRPNIYFDVKNSIANFVLQINTVDFLDDNNNPIPGNTEMVKIIPICNKQQVGDYFSGTSAATRVNGILSIRYLNGFICDNINIQFNRNFLIDKGTGTISRQ